VRDSSKQVLKIGCRLSSYAHLRDAALMAQRDHLLDGQDKARHACDVVEYRQLHAALESNSTVLWIEMAGPNFCPPTLCFRKSLKSKKLFGSFGMK
jgi:hypothetical protein